MSTSKFEALQVWRKSKALCVNVYSVTNSGPFARDFGLRDQVRRASVSVMSNIAEGFERFGAVEFQRFLAMARGSAAEVRSQIYLAKDLGYVDDAQMRRLVADCLEVTRMITALRNSIRKPP